MLASGAGSGAGAAGAPEAPPETSSSRPRLFSSSLARDTDMTFMNSLSSASSIFRKNLTTTIWSAPWGRWACLNCSRFSSSKDTGVEISTRNPKKSDMAVAADPIIWFITSHTQLIVSSLSSNSSSAVSMPMRMSTITLISLRLSSMMLLPSRPSTYLISTPMAGSRLPREKSFTSTTVTVGVVISTRWSSMFDTAVAEEPRLIFIISPKASIAIGLNISFSIPYSLLCSAE